MIEFSKMPRGSYRAVRGEIEIDVFRIGAGGPEAWRWNVLQAGTYIATGIADTLDKACDSAATFI